MFGIVIGSATVIPPEILSAAPLATVVAPSVVPRPVAFEIAISGTGISSGGAIVFTGGNNTYSGAITLGATSTIISSSGAQTISATVDGGQALTITAKGLRS